MEFDAFGMGGRVAGGFRSWERESDVGLPWNSPKRERYSSNRVTGRNTKGMKGDAVLLVGRITVPACP